MESQRVGHDWATEQQQMSFTTFALPLTSCLSAILLKLLKIIIEGTSFLYTMTGSESGRSTAPALHLQPTLRVPQCSHLWSLALPATVLPLLCWAGAALCVLWSWDSSLLSRQNFSYLACSEVSPLLDSGRKGEKDQGFSGCLTWKLPLSAQNPGFFGVSHCALLTSRCLWALEDFAI